MYQQQAENACSFSRGLLLVSAVPTTTREGEADGEGDGTKKIELALNTKRLSPLNDLDPVARHTVALLGPQGHHDAGEDQGREHEAGVVPEHAVGLHPHQEQDWQGGNEHQLFLCGSRLRAQRGGRGVD